MGNFLGLREILSCVIESTQDLHPHANKEERLNEVLKIIYGADDFSHDVGNPGSKFEDGMDETQFFIKIAKERMDAFANGKEITVTEAVRKNINLVKDKNAIATAVKYWAAKYKKEDPSTGLSGQSYENKKFFQDYDERINNADEITVKLLSNAKKKRDIALNEVIEVLQKHGWPIHKS